MDLNREPNYPSRLAYMLQVARDAQPNALPGRLANQITGRHCGFASSRELLDAMASNLGAGSPEVPDGTDK